jgi:phosphopantetheinyl transferase
LQLLAQTGSGPWSVETTQRGKPIGIGRGGERNISISHTGSLVAAAVSVVGPIGIDIEWQDPARDFVGLATAAFGQLEARAVAIQGLKTFYRIWTVREAISKATGKGLEEALDRIDRTPDSLVDGSWSVSQGTWLIGHDVFNGDFSLALAVQLSSADEAEAMTATSIASSRFEIKSQ